jgi:hypothetical protein
MAALTSDVIQALEQLARPDARLMDTIGGHSAGSYYIIWNGGHLSIARDTFLALVRRQLVERFGDYQSPWGMSSAGRKALEG